MKKIKYLVGIAVVALLIVIVAVVVWIDHIAKVAVERGATYALGVKTAVDSVDIGIIGGDVSLNELDIANPEGFSAPYFLQLGTGHVAVSLGSLMEEKVVVPDLSLADVNMSIERTGKQSNVDVIIDNLKKLQSAEAKPNEPSGESKKFVINRVAITNVNVDVNMLPIGGELTTVPVKIERIELKDVGSDSDQGVVLSELTGILVQAILIAVVDKAGNILPPDVLADLTKGLDQIDGLGGGAVQVIGNVTTTAGKVIEGAGRATEQIGKTIGEGGKKLGEGLDKAGEDIEKGLGNLLKPKNENENDNDD